jgi:RHH-type proline utilization regulon transcriptional repressor/proline dehydrogenase/delta 1-pyrroline-5-carboxylate dehydrogenase
VQFLRLSEKRRDHVKARIEDARMAALQRNFVEAKLGSASEAERLGVALASYEAAAVREFRKSHDHFQLLGEDNWRRYVPFGSVHVRVDGGNTPFEVFASAAAVALAGSRVVMSSTAGCENAALRVLETATYDWAGAIEFVEESDAELARGIERGDVERIRLVARGGAMDEVWRVAHEAGVHLAAEPVLGAGRIELLWSLREQSLSHAYHRYGNLGGRERIRDERSETNSADDK